MRVLAWSCTGPPVIGETPLRAVPELRHARLAKGWSQQELANRSGARQATISDMENAKAKRVDLDLLEGLAGALDCDRGDPMVIARDKKRGKGRER
jgi:transcriptional regulator with XRE-family HTH domain